VRPVLTVYRSVMGEALAVSMPVEGHPTTAERLGSLFDAHHGRLYKLARRLSNSREDARDLVQETFLRAAQAVASIPDGRSHEEAWLVRVMINICRDGWRRTAVRKRLEPLRTAGPVPSSPSHEDALVARSVIWEALSMLPPRRRAALILYELEGATIPDIARLLGVAPVTVRWHLSRGRRDLVRVIRRHERREGQHAQEGQL
jgi:RNA polymerase sigma-70 factor, ECF subfamily